MYIHSNFNSSSFFTKYFHFLGLTVSSSVLTHANFAFHVYSFPIMSSLANSTQRVCGLIAPSGPVFFSESFNYYSQTKL